MLRTYYGLALLRPRTWLRLLSGRIGLRAGLAPLRIWRSLRRHRWAGSQGGGLDLPALMLAELERFQGPVWTVLSGADLTASEVERLIAGSGGWKEALEGPRRQILRLPGADHTMSEPGDWDRAIGWIADRCRGSMPVVFASAASSLMLFD